MVWLNDMLATPKNEYPEFPAALSFIFGLSPATVQTALERLVAHCRDPLRCRARERDETEGRHP